VVDHSPFGQKKDKSFMKKALAQAKKAYATDEVPVGAIVVDAQGNIIGRGYNQVEKKDTQAAHAEMIAISKAGKKKGDWRLNGCWLFVTLEPCAMCMNCAILSRLEGIIYGADSPLFGYQLDKDLTFQVYKRDTIFIVAGVYAEQSAKLLKDFFRLKRGDKQRDEERYLAKRDR